MVKGMRFECLDQTPWWIKLKRRRDTVEWVFSRAISQTPQCVLRGSVMNSRPLAGLCEPPCLDWGGEKNAVKQNRCKRDGGQMALILDILLSWQLSFPIGLLQCASKWFFFLFQYKKRTPNCTIPRLSVGTICTFSTYFNQERCIYTQRPLY